MKRFIFTAVLAFQMSTSHGQGEIQSVYWLRYQLLLNLSPRLSWHNEIDNRRFFSPDVQNQFIAHSRIHYRTGRWELASGLTYSLAYAVFPEQGYVPPVTELRPVLEASYEIPLRKTSISNRIRIDNRIFEEDKNLSLFDESMYVMRFRYRAQVKIPLIRNEDNVTAIGLRIADEIMLNTSENFYDQNRVYVTCDVYLNRSLTLETGYIYIYLQRFGREEFLSRHVLRLSLTHRINRVN